MMTSSSDTPEPRSLVVEFLKDSDAACPVCGYRLRGLTAERCSECGSAVHLEIAGPSLRRFWWLAAVLGCAVGAAITLLALVDLMELVFALLHDPRRGRALVRAGAMSPSELPHWPTLTMVTGLEIALLVILAWLITGRRRIARLSRFVQITTAVLAALLPLWVIGVLRLIVLWSA